MATQMVSRTQRRLERKQALILLGLVLAVSLVSFSLGVMVGRGSAPETTATSVERLPVSLPGGSGAASAEVPTAPETEKLTFYDSLPKGEQPPIGSGIKLPPLAKPAAISRPAPAQNAPVVNAPVLNAPAAAVSIQPVSSTPAPAQSRERESKAATWTLQVASFQGAEDARTLSQRLNAKGFTSFVQAANLGEKGVWHRVLVGPFPSEEMAAKAAGRLRDEEKLSALVRKS